MVRHFPISRLVILSILLTSPAFADPDSAKEKRYLKNVKQLTSEGVKSGEAYFSPDGKKIVFQSVRAGSPHYQIYMMNVDGSEQRMVSTGKGKTTCAYFNPANPKEFLFASTHLDQTTWGPVKKKSRGYTWDFDGSMDIFLARSSDGKIIKRLTSVKGYDAEGSYSPDGKQIVYTSTSEDKSGDLYIMNADGSNRRRITTTAGYDGGPFFSPDGKRVVFRGFRAKGGQIAQVFTIKTDGSDEKQLTWLPRINWCPIYHPNGKYIIYAANTGTRHNFELFLVKADGSGEVQISHNAGFDGLPCFSPDGKKLMWTSTRGGGKSQVHIADFTMPKDSEFKPQPKNVKPKPSSGYGRGYGKDKKGEKNPHGTDKKNPHGGKDAHKHNPHGDPHKKPTSKPASKPTSKPHGTGASTGKMPMIRGSLSGGRGAMQLPGAELLKEADASRDVKILASDEYEGRDAGAAGGLKAGEYLMKRFAEEGALPGGMDGRYDHEFKFSAGTTLAPNGNALVFRHEGKRHVMTQGKDWQALLYSDTAVTGRVQIAFCGYGITAKKKKYDDFAGVDVKGKIAVILTRGPQAKFGGSFGADRPTLYDDLRFKVANARNAGAAGVLLLRSKGSGWLRLGGGNPQIPVGQLSVKMGRTLLKATGVSLDKTLAAIDKDLKPRSSVLKGAGGALSVKLLHHRKKGRNIVARIPGTDPKLRNEILIIGAHYDHLGYGHEGSLAGKGKIHNGADDNASGTAGLLALARVFKAHPAKRTILFMAFDAEEKGLLGSAAWVKKPTLNKQRIVAMFNMDMIGRLATNKSLLVGGVGTRKGSFQKLVATAAHTCGIDVAIDEDGHGPSDHSSFYTAKIPVLSFFTQTHKDYHRPSDDWETVDFKGLVKVLRLVSFLAREVADGERPVYHRVKKEIVRRRAVRTGEAFPWFGSIPDYAQSKETKGVLLSGARPGSPAGKAGLKAGDVITKFAGRTITNIYDYTHAIQGCSAGQKIWVEFRRDGKIKKIEVTLGRR
ncbi:MAG: M28 family peptidase [Planctomycetota bacterium]|nr:M28 family peptidase [Planctomycetota bacterium]